jgi:hypothetical protein
MEKPTKDLNTDLVPVYKLAYEAMSNLGAGMERQVQELERIMRLPDDRTEREYA